MLKTNLLGNQLITETDVLNAGRPELIQILDVKDVVEGRCECCSDAEDNDETREETFAAND